MRAWYKRAIVLMGVVGGLTVEPAFAQPLPNRPLRRPLLREKMRRPVQEEVAIRLLRRMIRPEADYRGEQVTELSGPKRRTSRQQIQGDTKGRVRRDFLEPEDIAGDIMLIAPGHYRYFHKRTRTLDIAFWPHDNNDLEQRIFQAIRKGLAHAERSGEENVAGRKAAIVQVTALTPAGDASRFQLKFWIDAETGIQLKNERSNPMGLVSRSYLTHITVGAAANIRPLDFEPMELREAQVNPLFPLPQFRTLQEAGTRLPFPPLEPTTLPMGYQLSGVWVFTAPNKEPSLLLRYSNSLSDSFSLLQRRAKPGLVPPRLPRRLFQQSLQRWHRPLANGGSMEVLYIGHLSPEQARALYDSLK